MDLSDGLDDQDTNEFHDLFTCLNQTGNLNSFAGLERAADEDNRYGEPVVLPLLRLSKSLVSSGFDLLGAVGKLLSMMRTHRDDVVAGMEAAVEVTYGRTYADVSSDFDINDMQALDSGLTKPLIELTSLLSTAMLDGGPDLRESVLDSLDTQLLESAVCTLAGVVHADDAIIEEISTELIPHGAEAWLLANNTDNNLWSHGTGNSLRDLAGFVHGQLTDGGLDDIQTPLRALIGDPRVQEQTEKVFLEAIDEGHLESLPKQLLHLASVDMNGRSLTDPMSADASALQAAVRLLHEANQPLSCNLLLFEVNLDNLGVTILQELAKMDTGQVENSLDFLVGILDGSIAPLVLETAAETGLCEGFTPELLADLTVLERLSDPEVGNLVAVIHGLLDAVYEDGRVDRLEELVQILAALHTRVLIPPVEEVLRDLADCALMEDVFTLLPTVTDASMLNVEHCPAGATPLTFDQIWNAVEGSLDPNSANEEAIGTLLDTALDSEQVWTLIERGSLLALEPDAHIHRFPGLVVSMLASPDAEEGANLVRTLLEEPEAWDATLTLLESQPIQEAMFSSTDEVPGPLPFTAYLIVSDTVTVMLQTLDLVLDTLGANEDGTH